MSSDSRVLALRSNASDRTTRRIRALSWLSSSLAGVGLALSKIVEVVESPSDLTEHLLRLNQSLRRAVAEWDGWAEALDLADSSPAQARFRMRLTETQRLLAMADLDLEPLRPSPHQPWRGSLDLSGASAPQRAYMESDVMLLATVFSTRALIFELARKIDQTCNLERPRYDSRPC